VSAQADPEHQHGQQGIQTKAARKTAPDIHILHFSVPYQKYGSDIGRGLQGRPPARVSK